MKNGKQRKTQKNPFQVVFSCLGFWVQIYLGTVTHSGRVYCVPGFLPAVSVEDLHRSVRVHPLLQYIRSMFCCEISGLTIYYPDPMKDLHLSVLQYVSG